MLILIFLSIVIGLLRPLPLILYVDNHTIKLNPFENKHYQQSYQAAAHILMGILGTLWYFGDTTAKLLFIILTIVEVVCATITAISKRK